MSTGDDEELLPPNYLPDRPREIREDILGPTKSSSIDDPFVRYALNELDKLECATRPSAGSSSAVGKDEAAFKALSLAASLVRHVAEWAINHQDGLAVKGLGPAVPVLKNASPEFLAHREMNDQHIHETRGSLRQPLNALQARQLLLNILRPMSSEIAVFRDALEALEALQFGETLPILQALKVSSTTGLLEYRSKLLAVCYMAYQKRKGINKNVSIEDVADEFAAHPESIKDWRANLRRVLGKDAVDQEIKKAEDAGDVYRREPSESILRPHFEEQFGRAALRHAATLYKKSKRGFT